jgi:hypothetical protein
LFGGGIGVIITTFVCFFVSICFNVFPQVLERVRDAALTLIAAAGKEFDDASDHFDWFERRRLQKAFDAAKNWPPKRQETGKTYRAIYSDGVSQNVELYPSEIERWASESNKESKKSRRFTNSFV